MADLVTIAIFVDRSEALIARSLLESEGIPTLAPEDNVLSTLPHIIHAQAGYRLMVRDEDAARAMEILREAQLAAAAGPSAAS